METYIYIVSTYAMSDGCNTCDEVLAFNNYDDALTQFNIIVDETKVEVECSNWRIQSFNGCNEIWTRKIHQEKHLDVLIIELIKALI